MKELFKRMATEFAVELVKAAAIELGKKGAEWAVAKLREKQP